jgi:hypothetical protein
MAVPGMAADRDYPQMIAQADHAEPALPYRPGVPGKAIVSVYCSGASGCLAPGDVTGLARYLREHAAASS